MFSRSIRENITYGVGREVPQEEIEKAARAAAIHDVILSFPSGYNTLVGEKGVTLSGGQKQKWQWHYTLDLNKSTHSILEMIPLRVWTQKLKPKSVLLWTN